MKWKSITRQAAVVGPKGCRRRTRRLSCLRSSRAGGERERVRSSQARPTCVRRKGSEVGDVKEQLPATSERESCCLTLQLSTCSCSVLTSMNVHPGSASGCFCILSLALDLSSLSLLPSLPPSLASFLPLTLVPWKQMATAALLSVPSSDLHCVSIFDSCLSGSSLRRLLHLGCLSACFAGFPSPCSALRRLPFPAPVSCLTGFEREHEFGCSPGVSL